METKSFKDTLKQYTAVGIASLLIIFITLMAYSFVKVTNYANYVESNTVSMATVIPLDDTVITDSNVEKYVTVEYVANGKGYSYNAEKSLLKPHLQVGKTFDVVYNKSDPLSVEEVNYFNTSLIILIFSGVVSLFLVYSLVRTIRKNRKTSSNIQDIIPSK